MSAPVYEQTPCEVCGALPSEQFDKRRKSHPKMKDSAGVLRTVCMQCHQNIQRAWLDAHPHAMDAFRSERAPNIGLKVLEKAPPSARDRQMADTGGSSAPTVVKSLRVDNTRRGQRGE